VLGPAHPDYATSLGNLAGLYYSKGEYDRALPLYERALAIREQVLGPAHPDYATSLHNLAELYRAEGKYDQALVLFQKALHIREHSLGREHPETNQSLLNLANIYYGQGKYDEALPLLQRALEISERFFGKQHPFLAQILINLAEVYKLRNDFDKASPLLQRASQISGDQSILQSKASENLEKTKRLQNLGELATMMAHNIKNPVGNIRDRASAALEDIREGLFEPNELQPLLENIITQASRLYDIVENFRQFARGNRQKHEPIDCRELVKSMEGFYQGMFQHEKIDFKVEYQESLQYFIYANRFQLQEVLKSLLDNATEAVQNQSNPTVWLKISVVADQIIFSIEDNGKGINLQQREKLFMPFESSKPQGIGFGLYSSYQMVKENGGELKYEQQEGRTCFIVTLPKTEE
jgi:signal transduction histidine kinase